MALSHSHRPPPECLDVEDALGLLERRLPGAVVQDLEEHVDRCARCRQLVADAAVLTAAADDTMPSPSSSSPDALAQTATMPRPRAGQGGDAPPVEFDDYRLIRPLGRGGMGHVFLAHDRVLERPVAIKFLTAVASDAEMEDRMLVEARAAARLQHPNVVTVHRIGRLEGRPYLVTELVRGQTLRQLPKPVPWTRALEIGLGLARGLAAAHRRGVLHRDIKPANVMITDQGEVKLLDFGLAKLAELPRAAGLGTDPGSTPSPSSASHGGPAVLGTPLYMAPEIWLAREATRQSDVYSLGALLYELCAGAPPFAHRAKELATATSSERPPPLAERAPEVEPRFAAIVDRCLERAPEQRFASADGLLDALERLAEEGPDREVPGGNPYRGLEAFEAEHRALFFGRAAESRAIVERLRSDTIVVVTGDSGVGKSSLCRAGVLPLVPTGALGPGRTWTTVTLVPGRRPLAALREALEPFVAPEVGAELEDDPDAPTVVARRLARRHASGRGLVVFVDQLEELFVGPADEEVEEVAAILGRLAQGVPGVRLLATIRIDFLARLSELPGLASHLPHALFFLRPLSPEATRAAVLGPARLTGARFESEALVEALVGATRGREASLPLLQFALAALWEMRQPDGTIRASSLAELGGVGGALARHADAVLEPLLGTARTAARRILTRLVTTDGTRMRRTEDELVGNDAPDRSALKALLRGRLIAARAVEGATVYELVHEELIERWGTLRTWLGEKAESRVVEQRLSRSAAEWERLGRSREALWGVRQLAEAEILDPITLAAREQSFLDASRRAVRSARRWRRGIVIGVAVTVALAWAGATVRARRQVDHLVERGVDEATEALDRARRASGRADALRAAALRAFDEERTDEAERLWADALARARDADAALGSASQRLEATQGVDPGRESVRALLRRVLVERALLADRTNRRELRDELRARVALYDPGGAFSRRWTAPARLTVTASPAELEIVVARVDRDQGKRPSAPIRSRAPIAGLVLPPGNYLVTAAPPDHVELRLPLRLAPGEQARVHLEVPAQSAAPPGMVLVPAGRFLFGTSHEDLRDFLDAPPLHERSTGAYWIAKYETTYRDWIAYLEQLAPEERVRRTPRIGAAGGLQGSLGLERTGEGQYRITLQPSSVSWQAEWGQPLRVPGRVVRSHQDWRRLPVSGITLEDALAYTRWLDASGRIPGARLCDELEWERAARGADEREYPHGDRLGTDDANHALTYGDPAAAGPDEVGAHPRSDSPFGVSDMAGNVWEWTRAAGPTEQYLVRGGAFFYDATSARIANRIAADPALRDLTIGLRVCATPR